MRRLEGHPDTHLMTGDQLLASGHSPAAVRAMVARGTLVRLRPGIYTCSGYTDLRPEDAHVLAVHAHRRTVPPCPNRRIAYSHVSAAALHRLPLVSAPDLRVCRTKDSPANRSKSSTTSRTLWLPLPAVDTTTIEGIPVTTPTRTVTDLLRTASRSTAVCAADAALHRGLCTHDELHRALAEAPSQRGLPYARARLGLLDARAESPLESLSRIMLADAGLPTPELQAWLVTRAGRFRVDFLWPAQRVIGECDGLGKYLDPADPAQSRERLRAEKERDSALQDLGYAVVHWTWRELERPQVLATRIRRSLSLST